MRATGVQGPIDKSEEDKWSAAERGLSREEGWERGRRRDGNWGLV